jgi:heat shock protein HslJ
LRNTTFAGLDDRLGAVTLANGRWTGTPASVGSASRPIVEMPGVRAVGDLDGDGADEAAVLLTYSAGGSGVFSFLAVVMRENGSLRNVATTALPDRVQARSMSVDGGQLLLSGVRAGADDAACCPGELVDWRWAFAAGRLSALPAVRTGRLSLATLAGTVWALHERDLNAAAESAPAVTLAYDAGRFTGTSGCNRYFAGAEGGATPGAVKVGPVGGTRMACPEPIASVEGRFLERLAAVRTFGFVAGRLALSYTTADGSAGTMLFDASLPKAP